MNILSRVSEIFFLYFTSLRIHENPKMIKFQQKKVKALHKYCPGTIGTAFTEFVRESNVQNIGFLSISNFDPR